MRSRIRKLVVGIAVMSMPFAANGQFQEILKAGGADINTYMESYMSPFFKAFGTGLANGWYNTAAPHKTGGFDITASFNIVTVPDEEKMFEFLASEYQSLSVASGPTELPTLLGGESTTTLNASYTDPGTSITINSVMNAPSGIGEDVPTSNIPAPTLQLGLGLPKNTEIMVRYVPDFLNEEDVSFQLLGFGIKHDFKQWIPGARMAPVDLAILIGYTKMTTDVTFGASSGSTVETSADSGADFDVNALTIQAIASKKFSVLTLYGAVGINSVKSNFVMLGDYTIRDSVNPALAITLTDPVDQEYKVGGPRLTAGMRLKFAVFTLHADYTLQTYNVLSAGIGISIR